MDTVPQLTKASDNVILDGVNEKLIGYVGMLAVLHQLLFDRPLVVTSGKDSQHTAGSLHAAGRALDVRTKDKDAAELGVFMAIITFSADGNSCTVFDERALPGQEHIHIEYHGA